MLLAVGVDVISCRSQVVDKEESQVAVKTQAASSSINPSGDVASDGKPGVSAPADFSFKIK